MEALQLYDQTCMACAREVTLAYSTSFSKAIRLLERRHRAPIFAIYGFVRFADEIVDTFHDQDKAVQLARFKEATLQALAEGFSMNPVLHAFQQVVHQYNIPHDYIAAFLHSMEMDLSYTTFTRAEYETYIYGSAEVIGLMCLCVYCDGDLARMAPLVAPARALGSAFQKVNFLRDIKSDWEDRGRVYFPGVSYALFSDADKRAIEAEIAEAFRLAAAGIPALPDGARLGVKLAYSYYQRLLRKIARLPARSLTQARIRVSDRSKLSILLSTYTQHKLGTLFSL
jgi:phytoene synthase